MWRWDVGFPTASAISSPYLSFRWIHKFGNNDIHVKGGNKSLFQSQMQMYLRLLSM